MESRLKHTPLVLHREAAQKLRLVADDATDETFRTMLCERLARQLAKERRSPPARSAAAAAAAHIKPTPTPTPKPPVIAVPIAVPISQTKIDEAEAMANAAKSSAAQANAAQASAAKESKEEVKESKEEAKDLSKAKDPSEKTSLAEILDYDGLDAEELTNLAVGLSTAPDTIDAYRWASARREDQESAQGAKYGAKYQAWALEAVKSKLKFVHKIRMLFSYWFFCASGGVLC